MRHSGPVSVLLAIVLVPACGGLGEEPHTLDRLAWMLGVWRMETPKVTIQETWKKLGHRTFEGEGVTLSKADGKVLSREALILAEMGGELFYIARPAQNPYPVAFRLVRLDGKTAQFENPRHDFPQKITYSLGPEGSLDAWIEGPSEGKPKRIYFRFFRADSSR